MVTSPIVLRSHSPSSTSSTSRHSTDALAAELRVHFGAAGLASFVNALLVLEQRMTLELAFDRVL